MNNKRFAIASLIFILVLCSTGVCQTTAKTTSLQATDDEQVLGRKVTLHETKNVQPWILFRDALNSARVPSGIVLMPECSHVAAAKNYSFAVSTLKLRDALEAVTSLDDQSNWVLQNGTINIVPKSGEPELLKVKLAHFQLSKPGTSVSLASGELFRTPEVTQALEHLQLKNNGTHLIIGGGSWRQEDISLDLHDVTVQEALNAIATKHGYAVWSYSESHCNGKNEYSIDWVTR